MTHNLTILANRETIVAFAEKLNSLLDRLGVKYEQQPIETLRRSCFCYWDINDCPQEHLPALRVFLHRYELEDGIDVTSNLFILTEEEQSTLIKAERELKRFPLPRLGYAPV
ncbi:MAG: hypothetical protein Athens101428_761 [Candidatus Berkelbacteria bacterium Athens1014_28]|uniref:Uncharacterized protein n=1 Tax=Candidatus Berkelbacteria bacterium Athens1014_28 TaxID=2017145 RepID=A0A554LJG9_9BACT|nr:MAG: hypothetical protein Athens101428_761 [Candidatus Berkelbacteria bacterium Athens1014_28]